jgi:uncharacterized membrane protein
VTEGADNGRAPAGGNNRRLRLFLMLSLAFNLLVIGALAGTAGWRKFGHGHGSPRGEDFGLMGFSRSLPSDRGDALRKSLKQERANLRPLKRDIEAAREAAAEVLGAEPYNKDALRSAIEKIAEAEGKLKSSGQAIFLNSVEQMTPGERRALSEMWKKKRGRFMRDRPSEDKAPPEG